MSLYIIKFTIYFLIIYWNALNIEREKQSQGGDEVSLNVLQYVITFIIVLDKLYIWPKKNEQINQVICSSREIDSIFNKLKTIWAKIKNLPRI